MKIDEFRGLACAILRTTVGWQSKIARRMTELGYTRGWRDRTIRRWVAAGEAPEHAGKALLEVASLTDSGQRWPRGEWCVGETLISSTVVRHVIHLQIPRFVARAVYCTSDGRPIPEDEPADVVSGAYVKDVVDPENGDGGGLILCEIAWIDTPRAGETIQLLEAAADVYEAWEDRQALPEAYPPDRPRS